MRGQNDLGLARGIPHTARSWRTQQEALSDRLVIPSLRSYQLTFAAICSRHRMPRSDPSICMYTIRNVSRTTILLMTKLRSRWSYGPSQGIKRNFQSLSADIRPFGGQPPKPLLLDLVASLDIWLVPQYGSEMLCSINCLYNLFQSLLIILPEWRLVHKLKK